MIISAIVLPTIASMWKFNLLPEAYAIINELGLAGWFIYIMFEWVRDRNHKDLEKALVAMGKAQVELRHQLELNDSRRKELRSELRIHYQAVITRMRQLPNFTGLPPSPYVPSNLHKDEMHLKAFPDVWKTYEDDPILYRECVRLFEEATTLVHGLIEAEKQNLGPIQWDKTSLVPFFTEALISYADAKITGRYVHSFKADQSPNDRFPKIDGQQIEGNLDKATKVAESLTSLMQRQDVLEAVKNRRAACDKRSENKGNFDRLLRETVIEPCDNMNWVAFEKGECDDCKHLKEELRSLGA